jgi:protein gp37
MALTKTKIEYLDYVWNFYPGCNHWQTGVCPLKMCWAHGMARFNTPKGQKIDFTPKLLPEKLLDPLKGKQGGRRIGVCFTGDLFGDWVDPEQWLHLNDSGIEIANTLKGHIFEVIRHCPDDTFIFLTKNPAGLQKWSPFPPNAWVGVSATNYVMFSYALEYLHNIKATIKYISIEPMMERVNIPLLDEVLSNCGVNWLIIGQQTPARKATEPKIEWIREIIEAADKAGIPVFLKYNLYDYFMNLPHDDLFWADMCHLRQEFPKLNKGS